MPITSSAKKALRQSLKHRTKNLKKRKALDAVTRKFKKLVAAGKLDDAKSFLPQVYKVLDKTAKAGVIKSGRADRIKSRLTRKLGVAK